MSFPKLSGTLAGVLLTLSIAGSLVAALLVEPRSLFLPGRTSDGHHQIERECSACHTPFEGVPQSSCQGCHQAELDSVNDSHGPAKFRDPRTADMLLKVDALRCSSCHREHAPQITHAAGVTQPADFCHSCHEDIGVERPSHRDFSFESCASSGCHRYHDNTSLYEDFLAKHLDDPAFAVDARVPQRNLRAFFEAKRGAPLSPLLPADHDAPSKSVPEKLLTEWATTAHGRAGVNCGSCHRQGDPKKWKDSVELKACADCHDAEARHFTASRHGMRLPHGLGPMRVADARLVMKGEAAQRELSCTSCHSAHAFDTRRAAVKACMGCHDDTHTRAYVGSPHHRLWERENAGELPPGSGVSCATCHLPRVKAGAGGSERVLVEHNQNANLRPNDKFVRSVCLDCHGLGFTLDALADERLLRNNFAGKPGTRIPSLEMVRRRAADH